MAKVAGWQSELVYDRAKPDGMPRKVMDVSRLKARGWVAATSNEDGFRMAYQWYVENVAPRHGTTSPSGSGAGDGRRIGT